MTPPRDTGDARPRRRRRAASISYGRYGDIAMTTPTSSRAPSSLTHCAFHYSTPQYVTLRCITGRDTDLEPRAELTDVLRGRARGRARVAAQEQHRVRRVVALIVVQVDDDVVGGGGGGAGAAARRQAAMCPQGNRVVRMTAHLFDLSRMKGASSC